MKQIDKDYIKNKLEGVYQKSYNQYSAKPIKLIFNDENINYFNNWVRWCKEHIVATIKRTEKKTIKKGIWQSIHSCGAYDVISHSTGVTLTILLDNYIYVLKMSGFNSSLANAPHIYPSKCFTIFEDLCKEFNINLDDYKIENGKDIKNEIPKPIISMKYHMEESEELLDNCHHIDFHSSYPAGLVNTHPEFKPVIEKLYKERTDDNINKAVLNYSIGYMQSIKCCNACWAHLSRDAITDNNNRIKKMLVLLRVTDREILGINTDGIWYRGKIYHDENEGPNLGQYSNDHTNCLFRSKSDGAYEFIENGKYHAVMRGQTTYDKVKPRDEWQLGDIYKGEELKYYFDKETKEIKKYA